MEDWRFSAMGDYGNQHDCTSQLRDSFISQFFPGDRKTTSHYVDCARTLWANCADTLGSFCNPSPVNYCFVNVFLLYFATRSVGAYEVCSSFVVYDFFVLACQRFACAF